MTEDNVPKMTMPALSGYKHPDHVKLAVSICSNRPMPPRCAMGISMLIHHLSVFQVPFGIISRMQASLLPQARQECLDEALADECTHQLWIDDDIEPPADAALRMLHHMKMRPEIDIIASNYCRKQDSLKYTAEDLDGNMVESYGKIGLQEVDKVGMGLMMVRLHNLRGIAAPHFEIPWIPKYRKYMGEDRYFTQKLRAQGLRIFVDHGISNWTQHWGDIGYNFQMFQPRKAPEPSPLAVGAKEVVNG